MFETSAQIADRHHVDARVARRVSDRQRACLVHAIEKRRQQRLATTPAFKIGDRVRHTNTSWGRGSVTEFTGRDGHPVGGWWYRVEWDDSIVNERLGHVLSGERVLRPVDAVTQLGEIA